jgi:isoleucyl-tRNA synthetase
MFMFDKVDPRQSFPKMEEKWLATWKENKTFEKSVEMRAKEKEYVFYDGPPFATGLPHYGHILAGTMKDVVPRYQTMRGHRVERKFGWDCHGLPVENVVEKALGLSGKKEIEEKVGKHKFNEQCRSSVLQYTAEWEATVTRMGRWVDFKDDYKTMNPEFMESVWWVFKQLWDKDLIYRGYKTMHVCPRCVTPLSNFEVTLGYKDVKDMSVVWKFEVIDEPATFLLAWTTTPWSTLSTMGLSVGPDYTYLKVKVGDEFLIFVKDRMEFVLKGIEDYEVVEEIKGSDLVGKEYKPLKDIYREHPDVKGNENIYKVYSADYVEVTDGTGIVTINGSYGEIDMEATRKNELPIVMDVGMDGHFNELAQEYAGMYVKDMEKKLIADMEELGLVLRAEKYKHSYPHCWRCDAPLLNYATNSWFVSIDKIKDQMVKANKEVRWVPGHLRDGRFGKWLENARDWCISRNRFWGTPLPVWVNEEDEMDRICVGSIEELEELSGQKVEDLHSHFVDEIVIEKEGKKYSRTSEVLDCWFESGSMPYAQFHYPFEDKEKFESNFPAEFIAEGLDQTRGWFYTLVVLGTALFGKSPFKSVIVNGLILAEDGKKMSKRLQNYPDPALVFDKYGADALRFYLMNSPVVRAEPLRFAERGIEEVVRKTILPIWNSYSFFVTYASIDGWKPSAEVLESNVVPKVTSKLDSWVISELETLLRDLTVEMDNYDLQSATEPISKFIDSLTNWYIRRSRRRFWKSDSDNDKNEAYSTLYYCLVKLSQIIAPFMPFISEEIYTNLTSKDSVHLSDWPAYDESKINTDLNKEMELVRDVVNLGHSLRSKKKVKVRQPLAKVSVALPEGVDATMIESQKDVILEELNVKSLEILDGSDGFVEIVVQADARVLGPKYGARVQEIIKAVKGGEFKLLDDGKVEVLDIVLDGDEVEVGYRGKEGLDIESDGGMVVMLDFELTEDLVSEGHAREIVRYVQELRKKADYNVDDRITVLVSTSDSLAKSLESFSDYIAAETLANEVVSEGDSWDCEEKFDIDGVEVIVAVKK